MPAPAQPTFAMSSSGAAEQRVPRLGYADELGAAIRAVLRPDVTFAELVTSLEGADPPTVAGALRILVGSEAALAGALLKEAGTVVLPEPPSPLPITHPLDFAWHFGNATLAELL